MAAKRIGSALTNIEGSANQIVRVKTDESGFEFYSPSVIPSYTITNDTTTRTLNAATTGLDELADIISTLIKDVNGTIVGVSKAATAFQWSSSEQVWPFEKGPNGETCYAKRVSGVIDGYSYGLNHGMTAGFKVVRIMSTCGAGGAMILNPGYSSAGGINWQIGLDINGTSLHYQIGTSWGPYGVIGSTMVAYLIYTV